MCDRVCMRFPTKRFLLEGRQTAIETVVWPSRERERARETEGEKRGGTAGLVKLTVPPFTQVLPPPNAEKTSRTSKNTKEQVKLLFFFFPPDGGLLQTPAA